MNRLIKKVKKREIKRQIDRLERVNKRKNQMVVYHVRQKLERYKRRQYERNMDRRKREFERRRKPKTVVIKHGNKKKKIPRRLERQLAYRKYEVVQNLVSKMVREKYVDGRRTHMERLQHPPMYERPMFEVDRKEIVRQVYLRDRRLHLDRNYHLH